MIRNPDMVVGVINGVEIVKPDFYKVFLFAGTDSKITQHECLFEGKGAYEKLSNHVILAQITIKGQRREGDKHKDIEHTPLVYCVNALKHRTMSGDEKIWRYTDLFKFEDLIKSKAIYFARIDQFEDNLEGIAPDITIHNIMSDHEKNEEQKLETVRLYKIRIEKNRKISFASCWHINENVNHSLWNEYGHYSHESIGIQTNVSKLNKELKKSGLPILNEPVEYFEEPYFNQNVYWFPTMFKRSKYKSEQEYRTILFLPGIDLKGLRIPINIEELISKIHIHPNASQEFSKKIEQFIADYGFKIPIVQEKK